MDDQDDNSQSQLIHDWVPLIFIVVGLLVNRIGIDNYAILMYCGFLLYGGLGLETPIKQKYYTKSFLKILKVLALLSISVIALTSLIGQRNLFLPLIALVLLDRLILTPSRLEKGSG